MAEPFSKDGLEIVAEKKLDICKSGFPQFLALLAPRKVEAWEEVGLRSLIQEIVSDRMIGCDALEEWNDLDDIEYKVEESRRRLILVKITLPCVKLMQAIEATEDIVMAKVLAQMMENMGRGPMRRSPNPFGGSLRL